MSPLGFKARVGSLIQAWWRCTCYTFPEIHLWCDTCQPLGGQHGSRVVSSTYLWGISRTWNRELSCRHSQCEIRQARRCTDWAILVRFGWGNHCFLLCSSCPLSRSRSRAMCMSHKTQIIVFAQCVEHLIFFRITQPDGCEQFNFLGFEFNFWYYKRLFRHEACFLICFEHHHVHLLFMFYILNLHVLLIDFCVLQVIR